MKYPLNQDNAFSFISNISSGVSDFKNKFIEVCMANSKWDFHTPKVNCPILYLAASNNFKDELNEISDDLLQFIANEPKI